MEFYYKALGENGYIEVLHQNKLFLKVKQSNYFLRINYNFLIDDRIIFKSRLSYLPFWQKVKILYQKLSEPIELINSINWKESELSYGNTVLGIKRHRLLKRSMWLLYKNGFEVGHIEWAKAVSIGGEYNISIVDEDETVNIYFMILFTSSMPNI
jgi:hypothetical protein